jgi:hypothetical protein
MHSENVSDSGSLHDEAWDREIGSTWTRIFELHSLDPTGNVAEAGPGFSLKIGMGLQAYGFRGTLYLVEPNAQVRDWVVPRYRELLPSANVIALPSKLASAGRDIPFKLDALLMNHLLDDLMLDAITPEPRCNAIFANMHRGAPCRAEVRSLWQSLADNADQLSSVSQTVIRDVCALYRHTRPRLLGMNQYPSWYQARNGLGMVDEMSAPLLQQLKRDLQPSGQLLPSDADGQHWLVLDGN